MRRSAEREATAIPALSNAAHDTTLHDTLTPTFHYTMHRIILITLLALSSLTMTAADVAATKYRYLYIEAVRQQDADNYAEAFELFRRCHELRPEAAETNYALAVFYLAMGKDTVGIRHLEDAVSAEPDNTEFAERLAQTYLYRNRLSEATEVYERLVKAQPSRTDYLELLIRIYEQQRDYPNLLDALGRMELQEGQTEEITLAKMQVHSLMGDEDGAYRELKSLTDAHPNDMNLQVMMGNWLLGSGRKEEALATFLKVQREDPGNSKGQMSLMDYYRGEGNTAEADKLLYDMLVNPKTEPATRVTLLRDWVKDSEQNGGDSARIVELFNRVLALPQATSEVAEMKTAYLELKNAPRDSIRAGWERVLEISPEYVAARLQLIQIMWADTIDENVVRECKTATEYIPDEPVLYYYLGVAQYMTKDYKGAIASLRRGVGTITKETPSHVAANLYEMLGDVLQKVQRNDEAYEAYDSCLVYDPDKVMCLNNYAYFLSCENRDLKKAEKMSYRAITAEANNSTYLDTYAWILYKQKRYEEARIYIDRALQCDTVVEEANGEILDHAGDIYFQLGHKEEALDMWQKALPLGVENEGILRKKIQKKRLVEK